MKKLFLIAAVLTFGISLAQQKEDMNLRGERKRVVQGIKSGEIKKGEAKVIANQASQLKRTEARAKSDGVITNKERAKIARKDAKLDRTIRRTKNN
jgi:hypothetical protein